VAGEYHDFMTAVLQPNCSIDDQSLGASNAEVRMEEEGGLLLFCCRHFVMCMCELLGRQRGRLVFRVTDFLQLVALTEPRANEEPLS
jgi:hypothetical protein